MRSIESRNWREAIHDDTLDRVMGIVGGWVFLGEEEDLLRTSCIHLFTILRSTEYKGIYTATVG